MKKNFQSQKGLTLVEVLISIVLLSIILLTFMGFFTQSALFTKKNEEKLGTMQTAQKYINLIEYNLVSSDLEGKGNTITKSQIEQLIHEIDDTVTFSDQYDVEGVITKTTEGLTQIKITVYDKNDRNNKSITYTYLRE